MEDKINLIKILKNCTEGTKLYCTLYGDVKFYKIVEGIEYPIIVSAFSKKGKELLEYFTKEGLVWKDSNGECLLFPSKDNRNWSTFQTNK